MILEDTNGDGRADRRTVFAEGLNIPTSFVFADGGVIVAQAPDFLFFRDTTGDDRADPAVAERTTQRGDDPRLSSRTREVGRLVDDARVPRPRIGQRLRAVKVEAPLLVASHLPPALAVELLDRNRARNAADIGRQIICELWRERPPEGNVADRQTASGSEHPCDLAEDGPLVGGQIDHAVTDYAINRIVG